MNPGFLINDCIEFWPAASRIIVRGENKQEVQLPQPAARCLDLLVRNQRLVTQGEFYHYVWGEAGAEVTPNALYQNISILRRAFRSLISEQNDWIVTIPRQGFRLNSHVQIKNIHAVSGESDGNHANDGNEMPAGNETATNKKRGIEANSRVIKPRLKTGYYCSIITLLILIAMVNLQVLNNDRSFSRIISSYDLHKRVGACFIYSNRKVNPTPETDRFIVKHINCGQTPWNYVSAYEFVRLRTIVSCDAPLNSSRTPSCVTRSLMGAE